jgi:hypothetical protein
MQIKDRELIDDKKRLEEIEFLKYQTNHLQSFLRNVNESNKRSIRGFIGIHSRTNFILNNSDGIKQANTYFMHFASDR